MAYLEDAGVEVVDSLSLQVPDNLAVARLDPADLREHHRKLDLTHADALVLSACVQMPSLPSVQPVQDAGGQVWMKLVEKIVDDDDRPIFQPGRGQLQVMQNALARMVTIEMDEAGGLFQDICVLAKGCQQAFRLGNQSGQLLAGPVDAVE